VARFGFARDAQLARHPMSTLSPIAHRRAAASRTLVLLHGHRCNRPGVAAFFCVRINALMGGTHGVHIFLGLGDLGMTRVPTAGTGHVDLFLHRFM